MGYIAPQACPPGGAPEETASYNVRWRTGGCFTRTTAATTIRQLPEGHRLWCARAVVAERISAVAHHRSRDEVSAACKVDGASWDDVGHAFGMSPKNAREHFGTKPSVLPQ